MCFFYSGFTRFDGYIYFGNEECKTVYVNGDIPIKEFFNSRVFNISGPMKGRLAALRQMLHGSMQQQFVQKTDKGFNVDGQGFSEVSLL